jgi:hypothetical protein
MVLLYPSGPPPYPFPIAFLPGTSYPINHHTNTLDHLDAHVIVICKVSSIMVSYYLHIISDYFQGSCMFEYLPLKAGEALPGKLSFSSSELGGYQYDLILTATSAGPEASVHFRTNFGVSQVQTCRFVSFAKSKVEYSCKVSAKES